MLLAKAEDSSILVLGRGETSKATDTGYFDVGVEVSANTVAKARQGAAEGAARVISALENAGIDKKDLQTSSLAVGPNYSPDGRVTGYTVSTSVSVKVRKLDDMGRLIDSATAAGGNATRINGIRFGIEDAEGLRAHARERAVRDARSRAEELARLAGVKLGAPIAIEEVNSQSSFPVTMPTEEGADFTRMPVERGTGTIAVEVRVRWAIQS